MKTMKRSISILLSLLMALSVFSGMTFTASAEDAVAATVEAVPDLVFNGEAQALISVTGEAVGGQMRYKVDNGQYSAEIPAATNAGDYTVYYKLVDDEEQDLIAEQSVPVNIAKAIPDYTVPDDLEALCGSTLGSVALPEGWTWDAPSTKIIVSDHQIATTDMSYPATFTPSDTDNYETVSDDMTVAVSVSLQVRVVPPTCTQYGRTITTCACMYIAESDLTNPLEHDYDDGIHVDATCTEPGGTLYTCTREGCTDTEINHTLFIANDDEPALGHDMGEFHIVPHPEIAGVYCMRSDCKRENCHEFVYECDENDNINVYYKVSFYTEYAIPEDGYITASDGTVLADTSTYYTKNVGEIYVISGGSIEFRDTPYAEAYREKTIECGRYKVIGWGADLSSITGNMNVYAEYEMIDEYYEVQFMLPDSTTFPYASTGRSVLHGHAATPPEVNPTKASDKTYNYVFSGWDTDFSHVYSSIRVTATFDAVKRVYKINYHDQNGDIITSELFNNGDPALRYPQTVPSYSDENYDYTFSGKWTLYNGAPVDLRSLVVPNYCLNEYDAALESDESIANIDKGILDVYPVFTKTAKVYPIIVTVTNQYNFPLSGVKVQLIDKDRLTVATKTTGSDGQVSFDIINGVYTVKITYNNIVQELPAETSTEAPTAVNFALEIVPEEPVVQEECGCACHAPLFGRIYIMFHNIVFILTGKKTVCCDDMFEGQYAKKLKYTI